MSHANIADRKHFFKSVALAFPANKLKTGIGIGVIDWGCSILAVKAWKHPSLCQPRHTATRGNIGLAGHTFICSIDAKFPSTFLNSKCAKRAQIHNHGACFGAFPAPIFHHVLLRGCQW
jgi:hypothetical protein